METLQKKYIVDKNNKKVAVQLDIDTFEKIEEVMENYALYGLMKKSDADEELDLNAAKKYYSKLVKNS